MKQSTFLRHPKFLLIWIIPLLILPTIFFIEGMIGKGAFVILIMGAYWVTDVIPHAITSLIPLVLFPFFGILSTEDTCHAYINDTLMIFMASLMAAIAVENSNLHNRISIKVLLLFGTSPKWLLLGFMMNTMFLSMWISNTATTALMLPIVDAVLVQLRHKARTNSDSSVRRVSIISSLDINPPEIRRRSRSGSAIVIEEDPEVDAKAFKTLRKALFLGICYAANIGGIGTLTGTGPNLVLYGVLNENMQGIPNQITFASWMLFNVPVMLLLGFLAWLFISIFYIQRALDSNEDNDKSRDRQITTLMRKKNQMMGRTTFQQWTVLILFVSLIISWFFRNPNFLRGWSPMMVDRNKGDFIKDATPAFLVVILFFMIPSKPYDMSSTSALLDWPIVQEKFPWNVFILVGGGFALAKGTQASGVSDWFSSQLMSMSSFPPIVLMLILCTIALVLTEISSNTATAMVLLPSIRDMAIGLGQSPVFYTLPTTLCCSFAFLLPIGSATNALVFEAGEMKILDMFIPGLVMKSLCLLILALMMNSWGYVVFGFHPVPSLKNSSIIIGT
ncbi:Na(+)/citrate cotransporter-like [Brevipalpus obovatus]|uniref:Na(+)/citrate cotransporter-like n=1 Tax=Brevipalpus obovatus TaxID=246614 RepID=UPI003D9E220F